MNSNWYATLDIFSFADVKICSGCFQIIQVGNENICDVCSVIKHADCICFCMQEYWSIIDFLLSGIYFANKQNLCSSASFKIKIYLVSLFLSLTLFYLRHIKLQFILNSYICMDNFTSLVQIKLILFKAGLHDQLS